MSTARIIRRTALLVGLVLTFIAQTVTAVCVSPPSGMVAWYPLDELTGAPAINDVAPPPSSIVNNVGTPKPGPVGPPSPANGPAPVTGQVGGALYFYTGHYVEVAPHSELDFSVGDFTVDAGVTAFTIDAWVRIVQVGSTLIQPIVDKFISPGGPGFAFYIRNQRLELALNGNTSVSTGPQIAFANPLQNTGPWTHVAVTVQGGGRPGVQVAFYINGAPAGTFTSSGTSINNALPLWIGESRLPGGRGEIAIDELELFSRALSATEIQAIYNAGGSGKCRLTGVGLYLNQPSYKAGDTLVLSATISPGTQDNQMDGYVTVTIPDGATYYLMSDRVNWEPHKAPVVANFTAVNFYGPIYSTIVPAGLSVGEYTFSAFGVTPGSDPANPSNERFICIIYKPGHEGDGRYCSQGVTVN